MEIYIIWKINFQKLLLKFGHSWKYLVGSVEPSHEQKRPRPRRGERGREGVMGLFYEALNSIPDSAG